MSRPLKVAIATAGRFHVLDLARELSQLGHDVKFYSYVPKSRALSFGLPEKCHVNLFPWLALFALWQTRYSNFLPGLCEYLSHKALNRAVILALQPCDVFIFMSGVYLEAAEHARAKYGAKLVVVRGSKHIIEQDILLKALDGAVRPTEVVIQRELDGYRIADMIDIPSSHVKRSFDSHKEVGSKTTLNPYGVETSLFPTQSEREWSGQFRVAFVGTWCLRKGCDVLVEAIKRVDEIQLIHIGPIGDYAFPSSLANVKHYDKVDQKDLWKHYHSVDCLVLPSREEGLAMVLAQALASGLPIICTGDTGGIDLCHTSALMDRTIIVPTGDVDALASALNEAAQRLKRGQPYAPLLEDDIKALSWKAYGQRYDRNLAGLFEGS